MGKDIDIDDKNLKKTSKRGLKMMHKSRSYHPVRNEGRVVKYGAKGFLRNFWLSSAATIVMSITMIILFITIVASVILTNTAEIMRDKIDITVYFKPNTSDEALAELTRVISEDPNIKTVAVSNSEEEYNKLIEENADSEEITGLMDEEMRNLMISKMQATMRIKVYNIDDIESIKKIVEENQVFVDNIDAELAPTYDVNQKEITTITSWAQIARTGGIVLAAVFLIISILIVFSTIRMAIFSRREEIYMMKLVGADKRFIRGPFMVEAEICGLIAGVIAAVVSHIGFMFLAPQLADYGISVGRISEVMDSNKIILVYLVFIAAGIFIGRISATLAISKYLHKA
ncbi:permease-like cell division protein FtsX [Candidatus Saccharibacteria bacterium]|nr:permease-like cell division protein FtsX [Candidatus Saccharibacteria bacterium]